MSAPAWADSRALQQRMPGRRGRIMKLQCPHCDRVWDVSRRGRETGFIVAAANNHVTTCASLLAEGKTKEQIHYRRYG